MNQKKDALVPEEMHAVAWMFNHTVEAQVGYQGYGIGQYVLRHGCGECLGFIYPGRPLEELVELCKSLEQHHASFRHHRTRPPF